MRMKLFFVLMLLLSPVIGDAQSIYDDFEGNGNIKTWIGDDCSLDTSFNNPIKDSINASQRVLKYQDVGGQFANIRFDVTKNFNLKDSSTFTLYIYVPSSSLSGNSNNQVSLKLQDKNLAAPWSNQCEIIKPIQLNKWQKLSFNFARDNYINLDPNSLPPTQRKDFNRVLIQVNGENNNNKVIAYIDNFYFYPSDSAEVSKYNKLVWFDEFNTNGDLDSGKWFKQTLLPDGANWYNGEIQHYTNRLSNSQVAGGNLVITAKKETFTDQGVTKNFTSARLNSKYAFTYGRVEVRAKLPTGVGTWPAIWTLGQNIDEPGAYWDIKGYGVKAWPACGEIDIMEHWGNNQNFVQSALHTPSSFGNTVNKGGRMVSTVSTQYHIYTLEWSPEKMDFAVDGILHYTYKPAVYNSMTWPFDEPQYFVLNIAIQPGIAANFTQSSMDIDYIRVYQEKATGVASFHDKVAFKLFPNPVIDQLNIDLLTPFRTTTKVSITNLLGETVYTKDVSIDGRTIQLNQLGHLQTGIYFLNFDLNGSSHPIKFIKN